MNNIQKNQRDLQESKLDKVISDLRKAIEERDKTGIINQYDKAKKIDLDNVNDYLFDRYEKLVSKGNLILNY